MSIRKCWFIIIAFIMLLSFTSCNSSNDQRIVLNRPTGLSCSVPTYDNGATIRWNEVPYATGYIIYVDDKEVDRSDKNAYAFTYEDSDKFCGKSCTIQAYDDNGGISLVSNALIIPDKAPITIQEVTFYFNVAKNIDNTLLIEWQDVAALKYEIYVGTKKIHETTGLSFTLTAKEVFEYNGQKISIKVIENNVKIDYIPYEHEIVSNVLIEAPVITGKNDEQGNFVITWKEVEGAASYNVYVDGAQYAYNITELEYVFLATSKFSGCEVSVRAVDVYGRTSIFSNTCTYQTTLIKPVLEVVHLENGDVEVSWTEVKHAETYKLYFRNPFVSEEYTIIYIKETTYTLSKEDHLKDAEMFDIYVEAVNLSDNLSISSELYSWKMTLGKPNIYIGYETTIYATISWYAVENAVEYEVYVNEEFYKIETGLTCNISQMILNVINKNEIYIIAISKQGIRSEISNIYVFE